MAASSPTGTDTSISSSLRFGLNDKDTRPILVYNHPNGITTSSEQDLCRELDKDRNLRLNRIPIPWGNSRVEVHHSDLYPAIERKSFGDWPNMKLNLANISLPREFYWKRILGQSKELYVVSPESSPNNSPESSQQITPNSTFRHSDDGGERTAPERGATERRG